jgi:molybdopterin molybdotransferase
VIGLPGNPVSALVIAGLFVVPVVERLLGLKTSRPHAAVLAKLALNLSSKAGREDWIAVKLQSSDQGYLAEPIFGKSNLIFTLAQADGLIRIPPDANGLEIGANVKVWLM